MVKILERLFYISTLFQAYVGFLLYLYKGIFVYKYRLGHFKKKVADIGKLRFQVCE